MDYFLLEVVENVVEVDQVALSDFVEAEDLGFTVLWVEVFELEDVVRFLR